MVDLSGPSVPPKAGGTPKQLVVMLHGVGADGRDLIGLADVLATHLPHARFLAPNAPEPCDMAAFGYQWFSLRDRSQAVMLAGIMRSAPLIDAFLDQALERDGLDDQKLALLGFSQGTMMALHVAPRRSKRMAAVVGFSGALLGADALAAQIRSKPPIFLLHGDADDVVPVQALDAAVQGLQAAGIPVRWSVRRGLPHGIDPAGLADGAAFLAQAFEDAD